MLSAPVLMCLKMISTRKKGVCGLTDDYLIIFIVEKRFAIAFEYQTRVWKRATHVWGALKKSDSTKIKMFEENLKI